MRFILVPGALAGVALGLTLMALTTFGRTLDYMTQELLGLALMVSAAAVAQCLTIQRHPLGPGAAFPARYFAAMLATAAVALVSSVIAWLHFAVLDPGYLDHFYARYVERVQAAATTPQESAQMLAAAERMKGFILDPFSQAMVQFGTVLMTGLLAGVPVTALVRPR